MALLKMHYFFLNGAIYVLSHGPTESAVMQVYFEKTRKEFFGKLHGHFEISNRNCLLNYGNFFFFATYGEKYLRKTNFLQPFKSQIIKLISELVVDSHFKNQ